MVRVPVVPYYDGSGGGWEWLWEAADYFQEIATGWLLIEWMAIGLIVICVRNVESMWLRTCGPSSHTS